MNTCGIDPSRANLAISIIEGRKETDYFEIENSKKGYQKFIEKVNISTLLGVYIEGHGDFAKRFALFCNQKHIRLYEINPLKAKKLKETITWDKSDHIDAFVAALMPFNNPNISPMNISLKHEGLKKITREHEKMGKDLTVYKNRFHAYLNQNYGPLYKKFFKKVSLTALHFFINFSGPKELKNATLKEVVNVLKESGARYYMGENGLKKAKEIKKLINEENPDDYDCFTSSTSITIKATANIIMQFLMQKEMLKEEIQKYIDKYFPGYLETFKKKFDAFGIINLAQIVSETGPISKFKDDGHLASYCGQASRNMQSAKVIKRAKRNGYNRHIARGIQTIALNNSMRNRMFYEYYEEKKKYFSKKLRALKSVKRIICTMIFEILTELEKKGKDEKKTA